MVQFAATQNGVLFRIPTMCFEPQLHVVLGAPSLPSSSNFNAPCQHSKQSHAIWPAQTLKDLQQLGDMTGKYRLTDNAASCAG